MANINDNFQKLQKSYLFIEIANKVKAYKDSHAGVDIISLGIGDVTQPLAPVVIAAMQRAVFEMGDKNTFKGYGPEHGYDFLRRAIVENDFAARNVQIDLDEVFVNDGAKSDTGNIGDILGLNNTICVTDPIYPVYIDSNVMGGRAGDQENGTWSNIVYVPCTAENNFTPQIPDRHVDIIYLCYPNNPTGTVISREELEKWVSYALANHSIIMYDAAYEAYIQDEAIPHSIYEIEGAKKCAIEFHSYSKTAGFTGVRCGYTIVPKELVAYNGKGEEVCLNQLWARRQGTKYNGTSYISQRAAEATYTPEGKEQIKASIKYYMDNARIMRDALNRLGLAVYGGKNAPYLWVKTPDGVNSWAFFDELLRGAHVVCTPGVGFGPSGEGYVRFTAFGSRENCIEAMYRISTRH